MFLPIYSILYVWFSPPYISYMWYTYPMSSDGELQTRWLCHVVYSSWVYFLSYVERFISVENQKNESSLGYIAY